MKYSVRSIDPNYDFDIMGISFIGAPKDGTVLFLTGIIGGKPMTYQIGVNENAVSAAEKGFGGDVTVHLELEGKKVKSLTIDTPDETEGLGKRASDKEFTDQFVGKEGPFTFGENGIDALSGATMTSNAALKEKNCFVPTPNPKASYGRFALELQKQEDSKPEAFTLMPGGDGKAGGSGG